MNLNLPICHACNTTLSSKQRTNITKNVTNPPYLGAQLKKCDHLGGSILLYVEPFGDRLLLMRTHEDLSSDMEFLVYVFYGFVVIFYLAECHGIYEIDYITSFFGGSCISKKKENAQRILSNCNLYVTRLMQMTTNKTVDEKLVSMFYFLNIINLVSFQAWSRPMTSFQ